MLRLCKWSTTANKALSWAIICILVFGLSINLRSQNHSANFLHVQELPVQEYPVFPAYNASDGYDKKLVRASELQHAMWMSSSEFQSHNATFQVAFTPRDKFIMLKIVAVFHEICISNQIDYFMYGGSLLGSFRHHDVIPWDDDIDVIVDVRKANKLYRALRELRPDYYPIKAGQRLKFSSIKSAKTSEYPWKWPYLDISFYRQNSSHICDVADEFSNYCFPNSLTFPLHLRPLAGLLLSAPKDTLQYLQLTYPSLDCASPFYSHKFELLKDEPSVTVDCRLFGDYLGHVERRISNGMIEESLFIGKTVVQKVLVEEPVTSVIMT